MRDLLNPRLSIYCRSFYKKAMKAKFISQRCDSAIFLAETVEDAMRFVREYKHTPITKAGDLARADWTLQDKST